MLVCGCVRAREALIEEEAGGGCPYQPPGQFSRRLGSVRLFYLRPIDYLQRGAP